MDINKLTGEVIGDHLSIGVTGGRVLEDSLKIILLHSAGNGHGEKCREAEGVGELVPERKACQARF